MKTYRSLLWLVLIVVIFTLAACSQGKGQGKINCSQNEEFCIDLQIPQSFSLTDPVPVTLKVTASEDIDFLHVAFMPSSGTVQIDGPETWEEYSKNGKYDGVTAFWDFSIRAGETISFHRVLHLPEQDGYYSVHVNVVTQGRALEAIDYVTIHAYKHNGKVYRSGTKVPKIQPEITTESYGPGTPAPTWITYPTDTPYPPTEAPDEAAPLTGPIEAIDEGYPAPVTPAPSETLPSYP